MNGTIREFTKKEFDAFVAKNGYETFTADQVLKFNQEIINNQNSMDEFSKSCVAADFVSLNRAIVVDNDLVKSVVYYRECQIEPLEKEEFGSIMKSKQIVFADTALNRFKGIVGLPVDNDVIEKARKAEPIGTEKTYGGKLYIKTEKGWRLKPKGSSTKKNESEQIDSKKIKEYHESITRNDDFSNENGRLDYHAAAEAFVKEHGGDVKKVALALKAERKEMNDKIKEENQKSREYWKELEQDGEKDKIPLADVRVGDIVRLLPRGMGYLYKVTKVTDKSIFIENIGKSNLADNLKRKKISKDSKTTALYRSNDDTTRNLGEKKEAPLLRQVTAAQYKDRKDEIIGEISKERLNLMNKYGDNWQDDASSKDLERLSSLVSRVNKLGENFNQFGDKSKNSSEHQMTEAQMRAYATARDPKAKEIELNDLKSQLKRAKETIEDIESSVEYGGAAKAEMIRIGKKKINSLEKKIAKLEEKK